MASPEQGRSQESFWKSGWVKAALAVAAVGVILGSAEAAAAGVLILGAGWAWSKGNK